MPSLLDLYQHAVRARLLDERLAMLSRAERIGYHPDAQRAEVAILAAALATRAQDWIFGTARDHAVLLARGLGVDAYLDHVFGNASDAMHGHSAPGLLCSRALHVGSPSGLVSTHLTHATGFAWAMKMRGEEGAVLALFSETAAESGDFHSAVNFAGAARAPIVFVCKTDGDETPAPPVDIADKGIAYGVPGISVEGEPVAIMGAVEAALARATSEGPTLLEVRLPGPAARGARDPLTMLTNALLHTGELTQADDWAYRQAVMAAIEAASARAQSASRPPREALFEDVHAELAPHLRAQLAELAST